MENKFKSQMIRELPDSEKPREKMLSSGVGSLSNSELLAVLISSGTVRESAVSLAQRVLALETGSLSALSGYEPEQFMSINGIGVAKACTLAAAIELGRRIAVSPPKDKIHVDRPSEVADLFMEEMRYLRQEILRIAMFDVKTQLIGKRDVSMGGIASSAAGAREVFAPAVKKGARGIIVVHNHPSGDPTPSADDISVTNMLKDAGDILGIELIDHIIIGDGRFVSLQELGYFR